jgi:replication factor C subunit 3/5
VTPDGLAAVLRLSGGDMRRVLNILQATSLGREVITEEAVYLCTGDPLPDDIKLVVETLLTASFTEAYERE